MSKIITVGGRKGGVGKSTIVTNIAAIAALQGQSVIVIDADVQQSSRSWVKSRPADRPKIAAASVMGKFVGEEAQEKTKDFDIVLVDVGANSDDSLASALAVSDCFVTVFKPGQLEMWTVEDVNRLLQPYPNLPVLAVLNCCETNRKEFEPSLEYLKGFEGQTFHQVETVTRRSVYVQAIPEGLGVVEMKNPDSQAVADMEHIYNIIME